MRAGLSSQSMSRSARGRPEGAGRRRRAARPLPEGPFAVPLSTIDWLVSRESPAARYVALRDLLGRPPKDPDLKKAKQAFPREPFVRETLALLRARLAPGRGCRGARAPLRRRSVARAVPHGGGCGRLAAFRSATRVTSSSRAGRRRSSRSNATRRRTSTPRSFARRSASFRESGGSATRASSRAPTPLPRARSTGRGRTEKDLLFFASIPDDARSERVLEAVSFLTARLLEAELPAALAPGAPEELLMPGFPCGDETDLVEMLYALSLVLPAGDAARAGARPRPRTARRARRPSRALDARTAAAGTASGRARAHGRALALGHASRAGRPPALPRPRGAGRASAEEALVRRISALSSRGSSSCSFRAAPPIPSARPRVPGRTGTARA